MKEFEKYYPKPYSYMIGKTFSSNGNMAFDFANIHFSPDNRPIVLTEEQEEKVVNIINGTIKAENAHKLSVVSGTIYLNMDGIERPFIVIRGWGYLTSPQWGHLTNEEAALIQDEFANYIIKQLTPNG